MDYRSRCRFRSKYSLLVSTIEPLKLVRSWSLLVIIIDFHVKIWWWPQMMSKILLLWRARTTQKWTVASKAASQSIMHTIANILLHSASVETAPYVNAHVPQTFRIMFSRKDVMMTMRPFCSCDTLRASQLHNQLLEQPILKQTDTNTTIQKWIPKAFFAGVN